MRPCLVTSPHHLAAPPRRLAACALVAALVCLAGRADAAQGEARAGLSPATGPGGTSVRIAGSGFPARKAIRIHAGTKKLGKVRSDAAGRFAASVKVPARAGRETAIASEGGGAKVVNRFLRGAAAPEWRELATAAGRRLRWTAGPLRVGEALVLRAEGLGKREQVTLSGLGAARQLRSDRKGALAFSGAVPAGAAGARTAALRWRGGSLSFAFMVSAPPPFTPGPPPFVPPPPPSPQAAVNGTLVVRQLTAPTDAIRFAFSGPEGFDLAHGQSRSFSLAPGSYLVAQTGVPGYDLTDVACDDGDSKAVLASGRAEAVVAAGETVTCSFTNTKRGKGEISQRTVGSGTTFAFTGPKSFELGHGGVETLDLPAGSHTVTQAAKQGYDLTGLECTDPTANTQTSLAERRATAMIDPGETVSCTFTNTQRAKLKIRQVTQPASADTFDFNGASSFQLAGGGETELELPPGEHTITQAAKSGYDLSDLDCDDADSTVAPASRSLTAKLQPGETVTCTFTNARRSTLRIRQLTVPGGGDQFSYTGAGSFQLAHDGVKDLDLAPGSHTVTQAVAAGYDLTALSCDDANSTTDRAQRTVNAEIEPGELVTCTFTNTKHGTLKVRQVTQPAGADQFAYTGAGSFQLANGAVKELDLSAGTHTITQTAKTGFDLTSVSCDDGDSTGSVALGRASAAIAPGETVTCTFTNTKRGALVVKQATAPASGDLFAYDGAAVFQLANGQQTTLDLPAGTHQVAQTARAGYDLTAIACDDTDSSISSALRRATAVIAPGETVTCTFTNTKRGTLKVRQLTNPAGADLFSFTGTSSFDLAHDEGRDLDVPAGSHVVTQAVKAGFDLTSLACDDADSTGSLATRTATANVGPGETVTCTFTNTKRGTLKVRQLTQPGNAELFAYTGVASFDLAHDGVRTLDVSAGTHAVTQTAKAGYDLTGLTCDDADSTGSLATRSATAIVAPGETVTCTFTNTKRGTLRIRQVTQPAGAEQFGFTGAGTFQLAHDGIKDLDLPAGTHTVTQTAKAGYDLTALTCDDADSTGSLATRTASAGLGPGETVTCTFTDTKRATVEVEQITDPAGADLFSYSGPESFQLSHGQVRTLDVTPGSHPVTQGAIAGYELTAITCSNAASTTNLGGRTATAVVQPGETVRCTFSNVKHGKLEIHQTTDPPSSDQFGYQSGTATPTLAHGEQFEQDLPAGPHQVTQDPAGGFVLSEIDCGGNGSIDLTARRADIVIPAGGTVVCTFTNTAAAPTSGTLVVKQVTQPASADTFAFSGAGTFSLADGQEQRLTLPAGTHPITQADDTRYVLSALACDDADSSTDVAARKVTAVLAVGETVTCTFTNARKGRILIDKETDQFSDSTFSYTGPTTGTPPASPVAFTLNPQTDPKAFDVAPGTWRVRELTRFGWRLYAVECADPTGGSTNGAPGTNNTATIQVEAGETVTCVFRSRERGRVTVRVQTDPAAAPDPFRFDAPVAPNASRFKVINDAALTDGQTAGVPVDPGQYAVSERDAWAWELTGLTCSDAGAATGASTTSGRTATFNIQEGEAVTCVYANRKQARLTIEQQTDPPDTSAQEARFSYTGLGDPSLSDDDVHTVTVGAGTQVVTQQPRAGYHLRSVTCESDETGDTSAGDAAARTATFEPSATGEGIRCVFTNVRDQPAGPVRAAFFEPGAAAVTGAAPGKAIAAMQFGGIDAGLVTWRGSDDASDAQLGTLLGAASAADSAFRWAAVHADERDGDPSTAQLRTDLEWLRDNRATSSAYLRVGTRFVVFVPVGAADGCATADRWAQAAAGVGAYVVMQAFPDRATCPAEDAPDDWYASDPAQAVTHLDGSSYAISPGWSGPGTPVRARDRDAWATAVAAMVGSQERWQLVDSYNNAASGTRVEPADEWQSATRYGDYLDALHADGAPVVAAAGDIACDPAHRDFNGGLGDHNSCRQMAMSDLLLDQRLDTVMALGDIQYEDSAYDKYLVSYDPSWGRVKSITRPAIGNHEYLTPGGAGYFDYFNGIGHDHGPAGNRATGYYSYDVGAWHVVVLNSNCSEIPGGCAAGGLQEQWLRADLQANPRSCTLAYAHHPRFSSGEHGEITELQPLWKALDDFNADVYLAGHDHDYERFAPLDDAGQLDRATGIRSFVVGTGGRSWRSFDTVTEHSDYQGEFELFGVLDLSLKPTGYTWDLVPDGGGSPADTGADRCH